MRLFMRLIALTALVVLIGIPAFAQVTGNLTGTITTGNSPLPGVTVTITSPQMQGSRTTTTDVNGNYNFSSIPPGVYKALIEMSGMQTVSRSAVQVGVGQTARADADLKLTTVTEAITVTAGAPAVLETTEVQTNLQQSLINKLPTPRTPQGVALLAPGVVANGPRNAMVMSGATADQNLVMVDGAVIQENLRGQQQPLYIEDAIQETTVLTGAISAEYGRFMGGVVNSISKSGGNEYHGSYRDNIGNPAWTLPTKFGEARAARIWNQIHEATVGGRIVRDRLWFFGAGRKTKTTTTPSFASAGTGPFQTFSVLNDEKRYEGKLTGQITQKHSMVVTGLQTKAKSTNNCQLGCLDPSTIDPDVQNPYDIYSAHYNGIISNNLLVESLYSRKTFKFVGFGGVGTDLAKNSPMGVFSSSGSRLGFTNSPYFCGSCGDESRNNNAWNLKGSYFLSTKATGSHNIVGGYERWAENRFSNNFQSPTNFVINTYATGSTLLRDAAGTPLVQVRGNTPGANSWFTYFPILTPSLGSNLRTKSFFVNDKWDFNQHWSFNVGGRYDKNDSFDSLHRATSNDSFASPRVGANYDILGNGKYRITAGYNTYVGRLAEGINGAGSPAGNPASFVYEYRGPSFASVTVPEAARIMSEWFLANGGVSAANNHLCGPNDTTSICILTQNIPGAQTQILGQLKSPHVNEWTVGGGAQIGKGYFRADYIDRNWKDFYVTTTTLNTGTVVINGNTVVRNLVTNSNDLKRTYKGIQSQFQYRLPLNIQLGGNYTYAKLRGNGVQENIGSGPVTDGGFIFQFPEYQGFAQNKPIGYLDADQRHKLRAWASYDLRTFVGNFNFGAIQRYDSGLPYSATGAIDVRSNANFYGTGKPGGITNPGYASNIPTSVTYFFSNRGQYRLAALQATDLSGTWGYSFRGAELYTTGYVTNVFNRQKVTNLFNGATSVVNTSIRTAGTSGSGLIRFNPFTETPKQCPAASTPAECTAMGANFQIPATFGTPTSKDAYQIPRTYSMAVGVRF